VIEALQISDFKSIRSLHADFGRLTVLVGPNGSGKTSVLEAIHLLSHTVRAKPHKSLFDAFSGSRDLLALRRSGAAAPFQWHATLSSGEIQFVGEAANLQRMSKLEGLWTEMPQLRKANGDWTFASDPEVQALVQEIRAVAMLRLNSRRLGRTSVSHRKHPCVEFDGYGLASALAHLRLSDTDRFDELEDHARQIVPSLHRIRFRRDEIVRKVTENIEVSGVLLPRTVVRKEFGDTLLLDTATGTGIPGWLASEGTLLVLGLLTAIISRTRSKTILLDDCEMSLHPVAQRRLVEVVRNLLERFPHLQLIATSHSPSFLDWLTPDEVRLMTIDADGFSRIGRLEQHPDFERWKGEMSPGEMWSIFGEHWIAETSGETVPPS